MGEWVNWSKCGCYQLSAGELVCFEHSEHESKLW